MPEVIVDFPASFKSKEIEQVLTAVFGRSRKETVENKTCVSCDATDVSFDDELSAIEYSISGMCQTCQDSTFGE
jgi:hypothetical protein